MAASGPLTTTMSVQVNLLSLDMFGSISERMLLTKQTE